jgi:hypothetical protein
MKSAKSWGLCGDSAKIYEKLRNWETVEVEMLPLNHSLGVTKGGEKRTIKPIPLYQGSKSGTRAYNFKKGRSPIMNEFDLAMWVSHMKLSV